MLLDERESPVQAIREDRVVQGWKTVLVLATSLSMVLAAAPAEAAASEPGSDIFQEGATEEGSLTPNPETSEYYVERGSSKSGDIDSDSAERAAVNAQNPAGCITRIENPVKVGSTIQTEAFQSCAFPVAQGINAGLQQYRALQVWVTKASNNATSAETSVYTNMIFDCVGSGSQLYRGRAEGYYTLNGTLIQSVPVVSSEVRLEC